MQQGWRAYRDAKRPKVKSSATRGGKISKKRRNSYKDRNMALREKGLL